MDVPTQVLKEYEKVCIMNPSVGPRRPQIRSPGSVFSEGRILATLKLWYFFKILLQGSLFPVHFHIEEMFLGKHSSYQNMSHTLLTFEVTTKGCILTYSNRSGCKHSFGPKMVPYT